MGRITIFALDDCPHCTRTKEAFKQRNIPYLEISLSKHPKKRNDMLSLSDRLTVPQIFVNDKHIGGADDTLTLLEQWDNNSEGLSAREIYENLVETAEDPSDPRLQPSTDPPVEDSLPPPRQPYTIHVPSRQNAGRKEKTSVLKMTETLKLILPREDLSYNLTTYKNAFRGSDLITALVRQYQITRIEALRLAKELQVIHHLLHHVSNDHVIDDVDDLYFRLQCDHTPNILNSYRVWTERVDEDAMALLKRLKKELNAILKDHTNADGKINYAAARMHRDFPVFEDAVCELQGVDFESMNYQLKLAFSINLYNMMIKYAFTKVGVGISNAGRSAFFSGVCIQLGSANNIGKYVLSFQDLENGILRSNRKAPYTLRRPFSSDDERSALVMPKVDNRIHFALNCGASSCPPVKNFTEDGVEEELRIVARAFCEDETNVRVEGNALHLSKIFYWYSEDFGGNATETAKSVVGFLEGSAKVEEIKRLIDSGRIHVKFNVYDWSTDASDFVPFTGAAVKSDTSRSLVG